jgi:nickel-dependent lactate racemase
MRQTFNECVEIAGKLFTVKVNEPADIIITAAHYPMDVNLYQSLKAIQNTKSVLKEGGVIILVSKCRAGIGNDDFIKHLKSESEPCELILKIEKAYNDNMFVPLGYHISGKLMKLLGRANIFVVSDISDEIVNDISFKSFKNIQQAVDEAVKITGRNSEVYIFRAGSITIPVIG